MGDRDWLGTPPLQYMYNCDGPGNALLSAQQVENEVVNRNPFFQHYAERILPANADPGLRRSPCRT